MYTSKCNKMHSCSEPEYCRCKLEVRHEAVKHECGCGEVWTDEECFIPKGEEDWT